MEKRLLLSGGLPHSDARFASLAVPLQDVEPSEDSKLKKTMKQQALRNVRDVREAGIVHVLMW